MQKQFQKTLQKTLFIGLCGLIALGIGIANASDATVKRQPNVLHEMVPHVVLPETIQYNKTAKNMPGTGYTGVTNPYVATYVAFPSYQVPYTVMFRPVGQSVYPVSPPVFPPSLPQEQPERLDSAEEQELALREINGREVVLSSNASEPIRLANNSEEIIPSLPMPGGTITQTGIFCQHPVQPPSAWSFSSPIFKVASVPSGWGGGQAGMINQNGPRNCSQQVGFFPANSTGVDPNAAGMAMPQQGVPYSTFQMGRQGGPCEAQTQVLPNGMILLTLPQNHSNCGLIRCRTGQPRMMLLPPAGYGQMPAMPMGMPTSMMTDPAMMQMAMMSGGMPGMGSGTPYMPVAQQQPMMQSSMMIPQMMPQMQTVPVMAMTPMGPTLVGYQQIPQMPMMNQMMNTVMNQMAVPQMPQMAVAMTSPAVATQVPGEAGNDTTQTPGVAPETANPMALVATPFGYAIQVPADALQADNMAGQLAQMQQALLQAQMQQFQMPMNPYAGLYATPFGYIAMNQSAGRLGSPMMMNVGYQPMGMPGGQSSMSAMELLQLMSFMNSGKPPRRARLFERIAERREARRASCDNDPIAQLMQAWTTPYVSPDTTLRMPAQNAYPYGYFGAQAMPVSTANYGGYHNLFMGNTTYPGLY